jgi:hypothetical protein
MQRDLPRGQAGRRALGVNRLEFGVKRHRKTSKIAGRWSMKSPLEQRVNQSQEKLQIQIRIPGH